MVCPERFSNLESLISNTRLTKSLAHSDHIDKLFHSLQVHNAQLDYLFVSNPYPKDLEILPELCNFLISQESLKELGLYESMVPLSMIFDCLRFNHKTLTALGLILNEVDGAITAISPADIQAIRDICTNLEFLQLELPAEDLDAVCIPSAIVSSVNCTQNPLVHITSPPSLEDISKAHASSHSHIP